MACAMACAVCCEEGVALPCPYCGFGACHGCVGRYILGKTSEPCCMGCKKVWSREFVMEAFDGDWVRKSFLPHVGVLIREQERNMLPLFQDEASLVLKIREMTARLQRLPTNERLMKKYKKDPSRIEDIKKQKLSLREEIAMLKGRTLTYGGERPAHSAEKRVYVMKCPGECRGYLDNKYVCGVCSRAICGGCHMPMEGGHRCRREDVLTASAIKSETKPCPKCMVPIFRAGGCSQVWCTQCHTAFDWNTGKLDHGVVHNPHYYEWLASRASEEGAPEAACGEMPDQVLYHYRINQGLEGAREYNELMEMYRMVHHVEQAVLPRYSTNRVLDNFDLRVGYLLGDFDDDMWATKLINREKKRMKVRAFRGLLEMAAAVMRDLVAQAMGGGGKEVVRSYKELKKYVDDAICKIIDVHGPKDGRVPDDLAGLFSDD